MSDSNVADAAKSKPSFMDLFALHLAARLVGPEPLLKRLGGGEGSCRHDDDNAFRVYWRTPLLVDTPSGPVSSSSSSSFAAVSTTTTEDSHKDDWNMIFLDVTVECDRSKREMTISFGAMLQQHQEYVYVYVTFSPLSFAQLTSHSESIGIDIESTAPDAIARTMGTALMGLVGQTVKLSRQSNNDGINICTAKDLDQSMESVTMPVSLEYKDLQETGYLDLSCDTVCTLNEQTFAMMLSNLKSTGSDESKEQAGRDAVTPADLTSFEMWWNAPKPCVEETNGASVGTESAAADSTRRGETAVSNQQAENVANGSRASSMMVEKTSLNEAASTGPGAVAPIAPEKTDEPKKPPVKRPQAGYARVLNSKKKRRGKLTFAKASK